MDFWLQVEFSVCPIWRGVTRLKCRLAVNGPRHRWVLRPGTRSSNVHRFTKTTSMSPQTPLSAEIQTYRTCATCYKPETKNLKFGRCAACQKTAYCSKDCQRKDWKNHKRTCQLQAENRESLPERGTLERDTLSDIKKWFSKHTQLMVYCAFHAMQLQNPENTALLKTHMLVTNLEPAPSAKRGEFVCKSVALRETAVSGLDSATRAALAGRVDEAARDRRYSLAMYVQSGAVGYFAPITVPWCHPSRFGPPDSGWQTFMKRGVNNTLQQEDIVRIARIRELI
ncbi:hypothetical protein B0H11DRAFT_117995 [Mycena galericulata]|nr:hypothetical protein B0H11DRAFT_117995 [Mycena galericulata]